MKKTNSYLIGCEHDGSFIPVNEVKKLLKAAQIDAIDSTVKAVTERTIVAKNKVLFISEQLKKELE